MSEEFIQILVPAIVGIVSSATTFFVAKTNNSKDLTINDRKLLSEDERAFRQELRESVLIHKAETAELRAEIRQYKEEISGLSNEVRLLREVNSHLESENQKLVIRVEKLTQKIIKLEQKADISKKLKDLEN